MSQVESDFAMPLKPAEGILRTRFVATTSHAISRHKAQGYGARLIKGSTTKDHKHPKVAEEVRKWINDYLFDTRKGKLQGNWGNKKLVERLYAETIKIFDKELPAPQELAQIKQLVRKHLVGRSRKEKAIRVLAAYGLLMNRITARTRRIESVVTALHKEKRTLEGKPHLRQQYINIATAEDALAEHVGWQSEFAQAMKDAITEVRQEL
jgi:hypothetical protein